MVRIYESLGARRDWKHLRQRTGRVPVGLNGTVIFSRQQEQVASNRSGAMPPLSSAARRASRQALQRFGSFHIPFCALNSCSFAVNVNGWAQTAQVNVLS